MTPTSSVEAVQPSGMAVWVTAPAVRRVGAEGACVSGQAPVVTPLVAAAERLPAASRAFTPRVYVVPQVKPVKV